jgi:hypothetical protein
MLAEGQGREGQTHADQLHKPLGVPPPYLSLFPNSLLAAPFCSLLTSAYSLVDSYFLAGQGQVTVYWTSDKGFANLWPEHWQHGTGNEHNRPTSLLRLWQRAASTQAVLTENTRPRPFTDLGLSPFTPTFPSLQTIQEEVLGGFKKCWPLNEGKKQLANVLTFSFS